MPSDMDRQRAIEAIQRFQQIGDKMFRDPAKFQMLTGPVHEFKKPYWYQANLMRDDSRFIAVRKGRQIGATTTMADKALYEMLSNPGTKVAIVSKGHRQSKWAYQKIQSVLNRTILANKVETDNKTNATLKNGSKVFALPAGNTGANIRGQTFDIVWFTEAAFIPEAVYTAVEPTILQSGGDMWLESTPMGKQGTFYDAFDDEDYSRYHLPSTKVPAIPARDIRKWRRTKSRSAFKQEILGEFVDQDDTVFRLDDLKQIHTKDASTDIGVNQLRGASEYFLGVDVARQGADETVFMVGERPKSTDKITVVQVDSMGKSSSPEIRSKIQELDDKFQFTGIAVDETGVGGMTVDELKSDGIVVDPVTFTRGNKDELYEALQLRVEKHNIRIPEKAERPMFFRQMSEIREEYMASGRRITHPPNGHDDYPDALALMNWAAKKKTSGSSDDVLLA